MTEQIEICIQGEKYQVPDPLIVTGERLNAIADRSIETGLIIFWDDKTQSGGIYTPESPVWKLFTPVSLAAFYKIAIINSVGHRLSDASKKPARVN